MMALENGITQGLPTNMLDIIYLRTLMIYM